MLVRKLAPRVATGASPVRKRSAAASGTHPHAYAVFAGAGLSSPVFPSSF